MDLSFACAAALSLWHATARTHARRAARVGGKERLVCGEEGMARAHERHTRSGRMNESNGAPARSLSPLSTFSSACCRPLCSDTSVLHPTPMLRATRHAARRLAAAAVSSSSSAPPRSSRSGGRGGGRGASVGGGRPRTSSSTPVPPPHPTTPRVPMKTLQTFEEAWSASDDAAIASVIADSGRSEAKRGGGGGGAPAAVAASSATPAPAPAAAHPRLSAPLLGWSMEDLTALAVADGQVRGRERERVEATTPRSAPRMPPPRKEKTKTRPLVPFTPSPSHPSHSPPTGASSCMTP